MTSLEVDPLYFNTRQSYIPSNYFCVDDVRKLQTSSGRGYQNYIWLCLAMIISKRTAQCTCKDKSNCLFIIRLWTSQFVYFSISSGRKLESGHNLFNARTGAGAGINCRKLYDMTFLSVFKVKGSLLSILNRTLYPEINSKCHDYIFSIVKYLTGLPSFEYKNRKLCNMPKLAVNLRGSYLVQSKQDHGPLAEMFNVFSPLSMNDECEDDVSNWQTFSEVTGISSGIV